MERVFVVLCLLGLCSLGLGNERTFPIEDDDSSADDEDFSGSGMEDLFTSDVTDQSGSATTAGPIVVPVPTEPDLRNVTLVGVDSTTKYKDTAKKPEEVLDEMDPTAEATIKTEARVPTTTVHVTASGTTADDLDVHRHHPGHHHHKTTSPSMVEDPTQGKSHHVHHIPLAEATTSPSSDDGLIVNHGITTTGPVKGGGIHHEVPVSTPFADDKDKTAEPTDVNESIVFGLDEKQTTKAPLADDSDKSDDHIIPTTSPPHGVELVEGGGHHVTTSPPLKEDDRVGVAETTAVTDDEDSKIGQVTTPADANKHHKHHGRHHHHPHHNHTTAHTTDSDGQHNVPTLEPTDQYAPDPTDVEGDVKSDEFTDMPEDHVAESSTHLPDDQLPFTSAFPAPDEIDTDFPESKEEESGDGIDPTDLFFETNVGVEGANQGNDRSAIDNGSSDASHGIMERKELLAGIIAGGAVGLIFASFLVGFVLYRMKKKDEGSYSLEEPKQSNGGYQKPREQREFYA